VISTPGTVLSGVDVEGCVSVEASNVTITDSLVRSSHLCSGGVGSGVGPGAVVSTGNNGGGGVSNLTVTDTEIDGLNAPGDTMGIGQSDYVCLRCNIHGVAHGAKADQNVLVQDSYIHDLADDHATHTEDLFFDGGAGNVVWRHNWAMANPDFSTAAASIINDYCPSGPVSVAGNWLEGVGAYDVVGGGYASKPCAPFGSISVTGNTLSSDNGYSGVEYAGAFNGSDPTNTWSANVSSAGPPIAAP